MESQSRVLYGLDDRPPPLKAIVLAAQHVLTMFGSTVAVPLLLGPAMGMEAAQIALLISSVMLCSGVATFIQVTFGSRLPIIQGVSFSFLAAFFFIIGTLHPEDNPATPGAAMPYIAGAVIVGGIVEIVVGFSGLMGLIRRVLSPVVVGPVIMLIGLALYQAGAPIAASHWPISILTMVLIASFSFVLSQHNLIFRMFPLLLAISGAVAVCALCAWLGIFEAGHPARPNLDAFHQSQWIRVSDVLFPWGLPKFQLGFIVAVVAGYLASMIESFGDYHACKQMAGGGDPTEQEISRGIGCEGIGCALTGVFGGFSSTSYSENVGLIGLTQVGSRFVVQIGAVMLVFLGLFGKFGALAAAIPQPVVGGLYCVMFGLISAVGIRQFARADLGSDRNLFIGGFALFMGISVPYYFANGGSDSVTATFPNGVDDVINAVGQTGMAVAAILGIALDNVLPATKQERGLEPLADAPLAGTVEAAAHPAGDSTRAADASSHTHPGPTGGKRMSRNPLPQVTLPPCSHEPAAYDGPSRDEVLAMRHHYVNPGVLTYYRDPLMIVEGNMQYVWDEQGKRYLDGFAGIVTVSVGHCHADVAAAVRQQAGKLQHTTTIYLHPTIAQFAKRLASKMPTDASGVPLDRSYFTNSGSEANEIAVLMSREFTGHQDVIGLRNGYHGGTTTAMGLTAHGTWKFPSNPQANITHAMPGYCYRCPLGLTYPSCDLKCAHDIKSLIEYQTPGQIACFIGEPIQGVGGAVTPPAEFFSVVYDIVRNAGGLCIADEVQGGFGRTGKHYWSHQNWDVQPDIITMAKGIGNGAPLGAVTTTESVASTMTKRVHFNTYGGNPVSMAAGLATMEVIDAEGIQENALNVGNHLKEGLLELQQKHTLIGDVRGLGLMLGVELVRDRESKDPATTETADLMELTKQRGLILGKGGLYGNTLRIKPPMCITIDDADFMLGTLDECLATIASRD